jgi:hypothetical protein
MLFIAKEIKLLMLEINVKQCCQQPNFVAVSRALESVKSACRHFKNESNKLYSESNGVLSHDLPSRRCAIVESLISV